MPSWDEAIQQFQAVEPENRSNWLLGELIGHLRAIALLRRDRNVLCYASAFLQKPGVPFPWLAVSMEDMNGVMTALHGLDYTKGLTLLLHSPGGDIGAPDSLMSYLHTKFADIEVIVPTYAMSAATMMALGSQRIIMGRQSQLGPIDAQLNVGGRQVSAGAVVAQCASARREIKDNPLAAHYWAPILQCMPPALEREANYALEYGQKMVTDWLRQKMFASHSDPATQAHRVASYFNATDEHKHHGRRIDREECRAQGVVVEDLEPDQPLQEAVLSAYHFTTLLFETSPATKVWMSHVGRNWVKNFVPPKA